jgi:hypothetical protein
MGLVSPWQRRCGGGAAPALRLGLAEGAGPRNGASRPKARFGVGLARARGAAGGSAQGRATTSIMNTAPHIGKTLVDHCQYALKLLQLRTNAADQMQIISLHRLRERRADV